MEKAAVEGNAAGARTTYRRIRPMAVVKKQPPDFDYDGPGLRSDPPERSHAAAATSAAVAQAAAAAAEQEDKEEEEEEEEDEISDSATDEPAHLTFAAAVPPRRKGSRKSLQAQGISTVAAATAGHDAVAIARNRGARCTPNSAPCNTSAAVETGMRER